VEQGKRGTVRSASALEDNNFDKHVFDATQITEVTDADDKIADYKNS